MSDDNVSRPVFGSQTTIERAKGFCQHRQMVVDEQRRMLTCKACGAVLDPFDVHMDYARRERLYRSWEAESRQLEKRVAELKEEERKIKARTANASRKDAAVAVAEEQRKSAAKSARARDLAQEIEESVQKLRRALGYDEKEL